jgi:hypothetical protein
MQMTRSVEKRASQWRDSEPGLARRAHSTPDPDAPPPDNEPVPSEVPQPEPPPVREPDPIPHQVPIRTRH